MEFQTASQYARRRGITMTATYAALAAGRIVGAKKIDGKWCLPLEQPQSPRPDFRALAANDDSL